MHKPDAVVRAYRAFVESFGENFAPPPARGGGGGGGAGQKLTREDLAQQKRSRDLSEVRKIYSYFLLRFACVCALSLNRRGEMGYFCCIMQNTPAVSVSVVKAGYRRLPM